MSPILMMPTSTCTLPPARRRRFYHPSHTWWTATGSISPAFEWAQSGDWVYINAKMSHKIDAPATLNVVSEGVEMEKRSLKFAASKDHKRFLLDLNLHDDIDPDVS